MSARPSTLLALALLVAAGAAAAAGLHGARLRREAVRGNAVRAALVERLGLTDLCLTTEARYTRHPSQADLFAAFGEHPLALEHFPSGSAIGPPAPPRPPPEPPGAGEPGVAAPRGHGM